MIIGDLLITRRHNKNDNVSPGYWNHAAILCENHVVIESLQDRGVVDTPFRDWIKDVEICVVLSQSDPKVAEKASAYAPRLLGTNYWFLSSMFELDLNIVIKGLNCVSVVRACYQHAFKNDPKWIVADQIMNDSRFVPRIYYPFQTTEQVNGIDC